MTIEADRQTAALDFRISGKKRSPGGVRKHSTGAPSLLVIEALGILGKRGGGSRVSVNGWALATSKITKLVLSIGTQVSATAFYGVARPDIARLYPARRDAEHCGFILAVDLPIGAAGTVELLLTVHTVDGRIGSAPLRIDIPPQQLTPPAAAGISQQPGRPAIQLLHEHDFRTPSARIGRRGTGLADASCGPALPIARRL